MKKIITIAVLAALIMLFTGCIIFNHWDVFHNSRKMYKPDEDSVRLLGRTVVQNHVAVLDHSGSGIEFNVRATKLSVTLIKGDHHDDVRFVAFLNNERIMDVVLEEDIKEYVLFDSAEEITGVVRIVKATESMMGNAGIKMVTTDRHGDVSPTEAKKYKIEFLGDSATAGYGVDEKNPYVSFKIETEDITKSYAYKAALALDADYSIICGSGWGVISGYSENSDEKNPNVLIPNIYDKVGLNGVAVGSVSPLYTEWDFIRFKPDIISILLGTNDRNYAERYPERRNEFKAGYINFISDIRAKNPDSYILCCSGFSPDEMNPQIQEAVAEYKAQTGDNKIGYLYIPLHNGAIDGYGADYHPTDIANTNAANFLVPKLRELLE